VKAFFVKRKLATSISIANRKLHGIFFNFWFQRASGAQLLVGHLSTFFTRKKETECGESVIYENKIS